MILSLYRNTKKQEVKKMEPGAFGWCSIGKSQGNKLEFPSEYNEKLIYCENFQMLEHVT